MNDGEMLNSVAIIGLCGRFPGARTVEEFWANLRAGRESIARFSRAELRESGVPAEEIEDPRYVPAAGVLDDVELFDSAFFRFAPREARVMDPQQRFFLECAWEALESAGYDPTTFPGPIGVYAGSSASSYLAEVQASGAAPGPHVPLGNHADFLTTRVSYKLGLRGPSVAVQTACSTSLVAVVHAVQALQTFQCDLALAGGVTLKVPHRVGYLYQEEGTMSPDGHCRPFDARAEGTVGGNGVGVVVLKRLEEARDDGDTIRAVIRGAAMNNDGSAKVGYTAPSVEGQAQVIAEAHALAGIEASSLSYVEAHGTATKLGDPVEVAALTKAFRASTDRRGFCAIGSVKSNLGHLDRAAGVAGLIKAALCLEHRELVPSLHFEAPNPELDLDASPFHVSAELTEWRSDGAPRRAGVSSFGLGGTNAHVVLEEAPAPPEREPDERPQLLPISARTPTALERATERLAEHLERHPEIELADAAYVLQVGRKDFPHRRLAVCRDRAGALDALRGQGSRRLLEGTPPAPAARHAVFLFPGHGVQHPDMGKGLYREYPVFREAVDRCCELLREHLDLDLRNLFYPEESAREQAAEQLLEIHLGQPALFVIEYALARLWMDWGVEPVAMIGHSTGELTAACLAGVWSLEDTLALLSARADLMRGTPPGRMLSVALDEDELTPHLGAEVALAASNAPGLCVVSGPAGAIETLHAELEARGTSCRPVHAAHAYHSAGMNSILDPFAEEVRRRASHPPRIPFLSNVTGTWITDRQATDPRYWATHVHRTVRFREGLDELAHDSDGILLEVGPGHTLTSFARTHGGPEGGWTVLTSLAQAEEGKPERDELLEVLGKLWLAGASVSWEGVQRGARRRRVPLPTYPFERERCWVGGRGSEPVARRARAGQRLALEDRFFVPVWKPSAIRRAAGREQPARCLILAGAGGLGEALGRRLEALGIRAETAEPGALPELLDRAELPDAVVLDLTAAGDDVEACLRLLELAQRAGAAAAEHPMELLVLSDRGREVVVGEPTRMGAATALGLCRVVPQEYLGLRCRSLDLALTEPGGDGQQLADQLAREITSGSESAAVAFRAGRRWVETFEPVRLPPVTPGTSRLKEEGVYLITGGLGKVGLVLAERMARDLRARLVLVSRAGLPGESEWDAWLAEHGEGDRTSRRIARVKRIRELGGEVLVLAADVTDRPSVERVLERARASFGRIDGLVHAVDQAAGRTDISELSAAAVQEVLAPKRTGAQVLAAALSDAELDFVVLCSSLASILGDPGKAAYAAANAYLDAFGSQGFSCRDTPITVVNWDLWDRSDEVLDARTPTGGDVRPAAGEHRTSFTHEEGWEAFQRILAQPFPRVATSTWDMELRAQKALLPVLPAAPEPRAARETGEAAPAAAEDAGSASERFLAGIWKEVLEVDRVHPDDNFFELGGTSLLLLEVIQRVRERSQADIDVRSMLFNSLGQLARQIEIGSGSGT